MKPLKPTEYESGNLHEQYSGESERRRIAAAGAAWGGASAAAGAGSTVLGAHRLAGRPEGQAALKGLALKHPAYKEPIGAFARRAKVVASKPKTALAGTAALAGASAGAGMISRFRRNEEQGISQGIGRIKAGARYKADQQRIAKSTVSNLGILGSLANDPAAKKAAAHVIARRKPYAIGASAVTTAGVTAEGLRRGKKRVSTVQATREALIKRDDHRRAGTAMATSGAAIGGTGLLAGGIPGVREPKSLKVWHLRGGEKGPLSPDIVRPKNLGHNLKTVAPLPRAGILGFRADMHNQYLKDPSKHPQPHESKYVQGMRGGKIEAEGKIVRGMRLGRRGSYGLTAAGAALAFGGHKLSQVNKANDAHGQSAAAMAGGGLTLAGVSQGAASGLKHFERRYTRSASRHVEAAQALNPHLGGLKVVPAKVNAFGVELKPARKTMYPERSDNELRGSKAGEHPAYQHVAHDAGRHRGIAAQERHFAEVFRSTGRGFKSVRNPSLAVAGMGAMGLLAHQHQQGASKGRRVVAKADQQYLQDRKTSMARAAGAGLGGTAAAYGIPRMRMTGALVGRGLGSQSAAVRVGTQGAEVAREGMEILTRPLGHITARQMAKVPEGQYLLRRLPKRWRAGAATLAGLGLLSASTPITRNIYRPVNGQPQKGV